MKGSVKLEDGCELFYEDYGEGDAVLFIPGLTCTTEFFEHNLQALADDRRILSYDPRSQGKSSVTEYGNDFVQRGKDLADFIDNLNLDKLVLAGWSLGAYDAYSYIQQFGMDKIKAFVTIDMPPKVIQICDDDWSEGPLEVVRAMNLSILAPDQAHFFDAYARYMIIREATQSEVDWIVDQSANTPPHIASQIVSDASLCDFSEQVREIARTLPVMYFIKQDWSETAIAWLNKNTPDVKREIMGGT